MPDISLHEKIQNMLDELPEPRPGDHRREYALSRQDGRFLANMALVIAEHQGCNLGITERQAMALQEITAEELVSVKKMVNERRRIMALIGTGVVAMFGYIGEKVIDSIDPNFWRTIFHHAGK